jgi:ribosomal protein S18 acetylase RimI-like enzyme
MPKPGRMPSRLRIRKGRPADVDALVALENQVFTTDIMSRQSLRRALASPSALLLVGEQASRFAGYALVFFHPRSHRARLYSIAVAPGLRGAGIGAALLAAAERGVRRRGREIMRLEVQAGNRAAVRQYERCGYRLTGRRAGYYDSGEDALCYEKKLA